MKRKNKVYIAIALLIAVVGVAVFVLPAFIAIRKSLGEAQVIRTEAQLSAINTAIDNFHNEYGVYPSGSSEDIFDTLMGKNDAGIRFYDGEREDSWRVKFRIFSTEADSRPRLYSSGADKVDDRCASGSDDIE